MINSVNNNTDIPVQGYAGAAQPADVSFSELFGEAQEAESKTDLNDIFERAADKYNVPVTLLKAIGKVESNFRPDAVSAAGACGVMQLMPGTAAGLGVTDSFDPEQNIMGGAKYISQMLNMYDGDVTLALAAYNAGCGNVNKYGGVPPFKETQAYVQKVTEAMGGDLTMPGGSSARPTVVKLSAEGGSSTGSARDSGLDMLVYSKLFELLTKSSEDEDKKIF